MSNHPNRSKNPAPRCLNCGNPLRKRTRRVWIVWPDSGSKHISDEVFRYITTDELLRTKADCQRLSNWQVVSVSYSAPATKRAGTIDSFGEWDGASYEATAGFFCTGTCAQAFARAAARDGYRRKTAA